MESIGGFFFIANNCLGCDIGGASDLERGPGVIYFPYLP